MKKPEAEQRRLQALLSGRFEEFNGLYFGGRLPPYRIVITRQGPAGACYRKGRRIQIREDAECFMVARLVHEMAHAAVGYYHGKRFLAEMRRLHTAGAPVLPFDLRETVHLRATDVRKQIDDAMLLEGVTLRQAQRYVASQYHWTRAKLLRRFPRAAKGAAWWYSLGRPAP